MVAAVKPNNKPETPAGDSINSFGLAGSGLGLRRALLPELQSGAPNCIDFFEVSPENWVGVGGLLGKQFRNLTERHRFVAHGLSLSVGGPAPLDTTYLLDLKHFLDDHDFAFCRSVGLNEVLSNSAEHVLDNAEGTRMPL